MHDKNTCILLYSCVKEVRLAIERLQAQQFNLNTVSIVGNGISHGVQANDNLFTEDSLTGLYILNEALHFQGTQSDFWESVWPLLHDSLFFLVPGFGVLVAAGHIVQLILNANNEIDILGQQNVLAVALLKLGIPANGVKEYEKAIQTGKLLLIVSGMRHEAEYCSQILHSDTQQTSVHLA